MLLKTISCFHSVDIFLFMGIVLILLNRDGHHSSTSNRHAERAKTSCSAPAQSRSPSAHRSRSVSAALRQAGSPVKSLTQSPRILRILAFPQRTCFLPPWRMPLAGLAPLLGPQRLWSDHWAERLAEAEGDKLSVFNFSISLSLSFPVAPSPAASWCSFSDRGDPGRTSRTSSISGASCLIHLLISPLLWSSGSSLGMTHCQFRIWPQTTNKVYYCDVRAFSHSFFAISHTSTSTFAMWAKRNWLITKAR